MARIDSDAAALAEAFAQGGRAPRALVGLTAGLSEPHDHGRSVAVLRFEDGCAAVYKPRDLAVARWFFRLIERLEPRLPLPLHTRPVLLRDGYGWEGYVEPAECASQIEVRDYYQRIGSYLRLFEVLRGADLHDENVLACGPHPVILDLETALGADAPLPSRHASAERRVWEQRRDSVLALGLLPEWQVDTGPASDHSGLAIVPRVRGLAAPIDRRDYLPQVLDGYAKTAEALRDADLALEAAAELPIRHVARPTWFYVRLLRESLASEGSAPAQDGLPPMAAKASSRREALLRARLGSGPLVAAELEALLRLDVPLFVTSLIDHTTREAGGGEPIPLPQGDRLEAIRRRQTRPPTPELIESAFASGPVPDWPVTESQPAVERAQLLAAAIELGERVLSAAVDGAGPVLSWLGFVEHPQAGVRTLQRLNADVQHGTAGIALTLARLFAATGDRRFEAVARRALQPSLRALADVSRSSSGDAAEFEPSASPATWRYVVRECSRSLNAPPLLAHVAGSSEPIEPPDRPLPSRDAVLAALARARATGRYLPVGFGAEKHNLSSQYGLCGLIERLLELYSASGA